jgi:hypothetical protein
MEVYMSLPTILEPGEVSVYLDPEFFRNFGISANASIDSFAAEAHEYLPQQVDGVIQYVVSGVVAGANVCISACAREEIAPVLARCLEASEQPAIEASQRVAREHLQASVRSTADSTKSGITYSTNSSAEGAEAINRSLRSWCA